jgi:hypothetical protein
MVQWLTRFKSINRAVEQLHGWIALFGAIGIIFTGLAAAMTWVASSITALSAHGWGVPVFAGIGVSLVVILGLSHAAVPAARAWRHMFPAAPVPLAEVTNGISYLKGEGEGSLKKLHIVPDNADLKEQIAGVRQAVEDETADLAQHIIRLDKRDDELEQNTNRLADLIEKLNARVIEFREELVKIGTESSVNSEQVKKLNVEEPLKKIRELRDYDFKQVDTRFSMLCTAVRARDMIALLERTNAIVVPLAQRLLAARIEDYPNRTKWLDEYGKWRTAIQKIDYELNQ